MYQASVETLKHIAEETQTQVERKAKLGCYGILEGLHIAYCYVDNISILYRGTEALNIGSYACMVEALLEYLDESYDITKTGNAFHIYKVLNGINYHVKTLVR